ncbi:MAG TPA: type II secretion system F family protein [Candidatus Binatia bacterium]|nr:type II secretion system F family protein [Candidatus Binatia bacterium]
MATAAAAVKKVTKAKPVQKDHTYVWEGTDRKGARIKGQTVAPSDTMVKQQLRKQGINPIRVTKKLSFKLGGKGKIESQDIAIYSRQMAVMMTAGVPLVQALEIVGRGHEKPAMGEMIMGIKSHIEAGNSFAESLGKYPLHFDDLFVNLVNAGEKSGALETLLDKIATYKEKTEAIKKKVKKALTYPAAVVVVAVIVTSILLIFVVPQFEDLFKGFGADLPAFTQFVVNLSRSLKSQGVPIVIVMAITVTVIIQVHKRSLKFRELTDRLMLRLPVIGQILYKSAVARFARTLATMFAAGVPLVDALESVAGAAGNIVFYNGIIKIKDGVSTGQQLQLCMAQSGLFPAMAVQMIAIGEESGSLDAMASKVADFYEAEVDALVDALSSLLEPMIMAILGVLVGGLVVAMYLPIFKMGQVV